MVRRVGGSSPREGFAVAVAAVDHRDARVHEAANRSRARSSASASWTAKRTRRCCSRVKLARAPRRRFPRLGQGANGRPHVTSRVSARNACHVSGLRAATVSRSGCGVINVDQSLQVAPFANLVRSLADKLRGPNFPALWEHFAAGMQIELLPESAQALVRSTSRPRQELVVGYWRELLDRPTEELADLAAAALTTVRDAGLPYLVVAGNPLEPGYQQWLTGMLPQVKITVWPGSGHFPHLAHPGHFAECLATTAQWTSETTSDARSTTTTAYPQPRRRQGADVDRPAP
jgi:pimeloyl-ACP methyl ester carboxylesterase